MDQQPKGSNSVSGTTLLQSTAQQCLLYNYSFCSVWWSLEQAINEACKVDSVSATVLREPCESQLYIYIQNS